jgi:fructose-1,6-bisphosphatase/inositol monophosphatase family enzyme
VDFALFTGSRPWDHAAGALALTEAGGVAAYADGTVYAPRVSERLPLLVARTPAIWDRVRAEILPPEAFRA